MKLTIERSRRALLGGVVLAAAFVAACGGGSQVQKFAPTRIIAFGDETSVIDDFNGNANGRKFLDDATVSANDPTLACKLNPNWIQALGNSYGFVFPQCNPAPAVVAPPSRIRATIGAKVADISMQIDTQLAESAFTPTDLVTVLVGQNDILAQYALFNGTNQAALTANVEAAGAALGVQINRIANAGAKVVVSTAVDLGLTPFAAAEKAAHSDVDRAALLTYLTSRLNASMRATIVNDGRMIGLVLADEYFQTIVKTANGGGFTNVTAPVCDLTKSTQIPPSALDCTTLTLVSGGTGTAYLWSDNLHLSSGAQGQLGTLAATRAANNPF